MYNKAYVERLKNQTKQQKRCSSQVTLPKASYSEVLRILTPRSGLRYQVPFSAYETEAFRVTQRCLSKCGLWDLRLCSVPALLSMHLHT